MVFTFRGIREDWRIRISIDERSLGVGFEIEVRRRKGGVVGGGGCWVWGEGVIVLEGSILDRAGGVRLLKGLKFSFYSFFVSLRCLKCLRGDVNVVYLLFCFNDCIRRRIVERGFWWSRR